MPATASGTTVPLFFPGETSPRDVPYEEMHDNISKFGAKPGVIMKFKDDPEQKPRAVPADQVQDASKAGGTIIPLGEQQAKQPGFWQRAYENSGMQGLVEKGKELYNDPDKLESLPYDLLSGAATAQAKQFPKALQAAKSGDWSTAAGRTLAGVVPVLGPMAADTGEKVGTDLGTGNYRGAAGDLAGFGTAALAPKAIGKVAPAALDALDELSTTKATAPVRAVVKGANVVMKRAPQIVGGAAGAGVGGYFGGRMGAEMGTVMGGIAGKELLPQVKLPGEGFGLPNRVAGGPETAPDFTPPAQPPPQPPPTPAPAPPPAPPAAPVTSNPSPGAAPLVSTPAIPKAMPSTSALAQQLADALGGKPLKPGVPLRNQMNLPSAVPAKLPEGFTPIEGSSALKGYKYDADTQEFDAITKDGQRFRHGEVTPEQVDAFQRADSAGKAWAELRNGPGVVPLGKVNAAGKVQPRIPSASRSASPDAAPTPVTGSPAVSSPAVPKAMPEDIAPVYSQEYRGSVDTEALEAIRDNPKLPDHVRSAAGDVYSQTVDSGWRVGDAMNLMGTPELARALGGKLEQTLNAGAFKNSPKALSSSPAIPKKMPPTIEGDLTTDWSKALEDLKAKQSNLGVERRSDVATRQKVSEMSPEAMRKTLLTSERTGLPNRRAFDESDPSPSVGMSDADALKALNDKFGYEAGNALLKAKGEALTDAGVDAYHDKGDEFLQKGGDDLRGKMEQARENLRNKVISFQAADGTIKKFKGADFSYGIGETTDEAEQGLKSHKAEREARGERARGELRGIVEQ